jgi:hypothetical protein
VHDQGVHRATFFLNVFSSSYLIAPPLAFEGRETDHTQAALCCERVGGSCGKGTPNCSISKTLTLSLASLKWKVHATHLGAGSDLAWSSLDHCPGEGRWPSIHGHVLWSSPAPQAMASVQEGYLLLVCSKAVLFGSRH